MPWTGKSGVWNGTRMCSVSDLVEAGTVRLLVSQLSRGAPLVDDGSLCA
jgi:hypothetical protein